MPFDFSHSHRYLADSSRPQGTCCLGPANKAFQEDSKWSVVREQWMWARVQLTVFQEDGRVRRSVIREQWVLATEHHQGMAACWVENTLLFSHRQHKRPHKWRHHTCWQLLGREHCCSQTGSTNACMNEDTVSALMGHSTTNSFLSETASNCCLPSSPSVEPVPCWWKLSWSSDTAVHSFYYCHRLYARSQQQVRKKWASAFPSPCLWGISHRDCQNGTIFSTFRIEDRMCFGPNGT